MKNPLVDALRQASDAYSDAAGGPAAETAEDTTQHQPLDNAELALLDTVSIELNADFYETSGLHIANDDDDMQIVSTRPVSAMARRASALRSGKRGLAKLGRYSPMLCLALLLASASIYLGYQRTAGRDQNVDLLVLSTQVDASQRAANPADAAAQRFANPFQLIVGPSPGGPVAGKPPPGTPERRVTAGAALPPVRAGIAIPDKAFAVLQHAYAAFEAGDLGAAEIAYREALQLAPRHPNALHGLAAVLKRRGLAEESLQVYETLLSVEPNNTAAATALLMQPGGSAAASSDIKYLLQRHPESASLNFALGVVLADESRWVEAGHYFGQAVKLDAGNADYLFNLGVSLERLGSVDEARHYYEAALRASNASSTVPDDTLLLRIAELSK